MATIILVMATSILVIRLHFHLGSRGVEIKQVSILIGKSKLIGTAQIKSVSALIDKNKLIGTVQK